MFQRKPIVLLASALAGCGAIFGIDDPKRPPPAGTGGSEAGASGQGTSRGGASAGGPAGGAGPEGGAGRAGDGGEVATGGSGAHSTGGDGGMDGSAGSGDGGEGGDGDEFPSENDPCPTPGALACVGPAQNLRLLCDGGVWTETTKCMDEGYDHHNCDRRNGACAAVPLACMNEGPDLHYSVCLEGESASSSCGPDWVTMTVEACDFGCNERTGRCAEASGDELIIDRLPATGEDFVFWPTPVIPVCFHDEGDDFVAERAAIRDEIESTWGRYSSIAFSGWNPCASSPAQLAEVRVSLVDDCEGELARIPRYGYPGPGAKLELAICKSYIEAKQAVQVDEPMQRYLARHLFGHVLGYKHRGWFMHPLVSPASIAELPFDSSVIGELELTYGVKPPGSLVNASGRCVGTSNDDFVSLQVCDGSSETRWQALEGRLVAESGMGCLRASGSDAASLAPCATTPEFVWETNDVQWRGFGGRCVTRSTVVNGASLVLLPCRAFGDADQTWSFDFYDDRHVRIRDADDQCLVIPEVAGQAPLWPELASCDGIRDELEVTQNAQLALSGYCVEANDSISYSVRLAPCRAIPGQSFFLSGPLGHDGGTALTVSGDDQFLYAAPTDGTPNRAQIFDYHF